MDTTVLPDVDAAFDVSPVNGTLGAEISGVDLASDLDAATIDALAAALVRHKVIFFRNQNLTTARHLALGRRFGALEVHPFSGVPGFGNMPDMDEVIVVESKPGARLSASYWHSDVTWRETPSLGSILRCTHAPPFGGDTVWADMTAAYEGLDDATRSLLSGLTAIHDWHAFRHGLKMQGFAQSVIDDLVRRFPPMEHPVVRTHPVSGQKLVYVNPVFTAGIKGMSDTESRTLLDRLYQLPYRPEYQVRFRWNAGDVAFWDNRSTQHYAVPDFGDQHRRMERVTIVGDRPF
jgi:taurine dioxygenase